MRAAKLYNRGPHAVAFRGLVEYRLGQWCWRATAADSSPVDRYHGDVVCPHLDHFHSPLSGDLCTPLCADSVDLDRKGA